MSPVVDENFIARWGVDTIALRQFMDDRPSSMLYEVLAFTNKYLIFMVFAIPSSSPNVVYKSMYPLVSTLSPENPTICSSWD